tara:strand:- start:164 stop:577 length:414 start_codon:yes stop_codon:yes gene_type:complete
MYKERTRYIGNTEHPDYKYQIELEDFKHKVMSCGVTNEELYSFFERRFPQWNKWKTILVKNLDNIIKEEWYPEDQVYVRQRHWDSDGVYMKWQEVMSSFPWSDDSATSNMMDRDGLYKPKLFDKYEYNQYEIKYNDI